jgi:hypothetical protein
VFPNLDLGEPVNTSTSLALFLLSPWHMRVRYPNVHFTIRSEGVSGKKEKTWQAPAAEQAIERRKRRGKIINPRANVHGIRRIPLKMGNGVCQDKRQGRGWERVRFSCPCASTPHAVRPCLALLGPSPTLRPYLRPFSSRPAPLPVPARHRCLMRGTGASGRRRTRRSRRGWPDCGPSPGAKLPAGPDEGGCGEEDGEGE